MCGWFEEMGLGIYEDDLKKWLKNGGSDLINCSSLDIEKEINLKSALHRKKIVLALLDVTGKDTEELFINSGKLDTVWVSKIFYIIYLAALTTNCLCAGDAMVRRHWFATTQGCIFECTHRWPYASSSNPRRFGHTPHNVVTSCG